MTWCVDNVDLCIFISNCSVLGKNGNTTLSLDIIGIHDTFCHFLILTKYTALF